MVIVWFGVACVCILPFHICTTRSNISLTSLKRRRRGGAQARADTACNDRPTGSGILHESRSGIRLQSSQDLSHGSQLESTSKVGIIESPAGSSQAPFLLCAFARSEQVRAWKNGPRAQLHHPPCPSDPTHLPLPSVPSQVHQKAWSRQLPIRSEGSSRRRSLSSYLIRARRTK